MKALLIRACHHVVELQPNNSFILELLSDISKSLFFVDFSLSDLYWIMPTWDKNIIVFC